MAWDWCLFLAVSHGEPGWGKRALLCFSNQINIDREMI